MHKESVGSKPVSFKRAWYVIPELPEGQCVRIKLLKEVGHEMRLNNLTGEVTV